jgi:hypothetical protein
LRFFAGLFSIVSRLHFSSKSRLGKVSNIVISAEILLWGAAEAPPHTISGVTRQLRTAFGFVFQFFALIPGLTAYENVELPLESYPDWKGEYFGNTTLEGNPPSTSGTIAQDQHIVRMYRWSRGATRLKWSTMTTWNEP